MTPRALAAAVLLALAICTNAPWVRAEREQDRPTFRTSTRLVEVSVIVTDKDRKPIAGLTARDFEIFDNRELQSIELFSVDSRTTMAPVATGVPVAPREFSNRLDTIGGGVTVVFFDKLNTRVDDQFYARGQVAAFLEQVRSDDRIGLYVLDSEGIRIVHDFTGDAKALVNAMARVRGQTSRELAVADEPAPEAPDRGLTALDGAIAALFGTAQERMSEHFTGIRADITITALESVARHLAGVRGRKNLVWISSGFPLQALTYRGKSQTAEINRATRALNDANVAIYTVDARGLVGAFAPTAPGARKPAFTTLSSVTTTQDILRTVAEETGGRAFLNTNDIKGAVRRAVDDTELTYTLGYYPTHTAWDGKYREIRVKVSRPGVSVRHRKGYLAFAAPKPGERRGTAPLAGAIVSPLQASSLGLTARVDPSDGKPSEARLTIRVDPGSMALQKTGEHWTGAVDVIVAQVRADGTHARSFDNTIDLSVSGDRLDQIKREGFAVSTAVSLVPDIHRLQIVVRDVTTGNVGSIVIPRPQLRAIVP